MTLSLPLALALSLSAAPATPAPQAPRRVVDRVAAIVNGDVVTLQELEQHPGSGYAAAAAQPPGPARDRAIREALRRAFDQVVADKLFEAQAKQLEIEITDQQVDAQIEEIKRRNGFSDAQLDEALRGEGLDRATFRKQLRIQLQNFELLRYRIGNKVRASDEDLRNYYQTHPEEFGGEDEIHVRHIFIPLSATASPSEVAKAEALGTKVLSRLAAGEDFGKVAKEVSRAPNADEGGDLGWIRRGTLDANLERPAFALRTGQVSGLVRFGSGLHVFKVDERRKGGGKSFEEAKDEIRARVLDEQGETYRQQYVAELRRDAAIDVKIPELQP